MVTVAPACGSLGQCSSPGYAGDFLHGEQEGVRALRSKPDAFFLQDGIFENALEGQFSVSR